MTVAMAVSARKPAWAGVRVSTGSSELDLVASSQTRTNQAELTPTAASNGLVQVDAARTTATKPTAGSSQANGAGPGTASPMSTIAGSASTRTAIVRNRTSLSTGYGVASSGSSAGSSHGS